MTDDTDLGQSEGVEAKSYWRSTDCMGLGYGAAVPHYAATLSSMISVLSPRSVFEFGCNAGRNLKLVADKTGRSDAVRGIDINETSVKYGIEHYGLDLRVGDETSLNDHTDNRWDLVYTVSVLDHIPDPVATCRELSRIAGRYLMLCEPYLPGVTGRIDGGHAAGDKPRATPFSYYHDYYRMFSGMPLTRTLDIALPTSDTPVGLSYRLMLYAKGQIRREENEEVLRTILRPH